MKKSMNMNPVVHFGMPAQDRVRMADFYTTVFGWKTKQYGPEMGNYVLATTTETDEKGMIQQSGRINGGFFTKTEEDNCPMITIQVNDIHEAMQAVEAAGGTVLGTPEVMPGIGSFINFRDTEGNKVSLMQPDKSRMA